MKCFKFHIVSQLVDKRRVRKERREGNGGSQAEVS